MNNKKIDDLESSTKQLEHAISLLWSAFAIFMIVSTIALLGHMSKEDNDKAESFYCQSVHDGVQPDYNGTYKQGKCPESEGTAK